MEKERTIFYCDTDSIFTSDHYPTGKELGDLSLKGSFDGIFIQPKTYALKNADGEDVKFKGFNADEFSFKQLKNSLVSGKPIEQKSVKMLSFRECMRRTTGIIKTESPFLKLVNVSKKAYPKYNKRKVIRSENFHFDTRAFNTGEALKNEKS